MLVVCMSLITSQFCCSGAALSGSHSAPKGSLVDSLCTSPMAQEEESGKLAAQQEAKALKRRADELEVGWAGGWGWLGCVEAEETARGSANGACICVTVCCLHLARSMYPGLMDSAHRLCCFIRKCVCSILISPRPQTTLSEAAAAKARADEAYSGSQVCKASGHPAC